MINLSDGTAEPIGDLDGVRYVSTPGHGYLTFTEEAAKSLLSEEALKHSEPSVDGSLCFEHDVAILIPLLDSPEVFKAYCPNLNYDEAIEVRQKALNAISGFYPEYLDAKGIAVPTEGRTIAEERALNDRLRAEKSPDLVVSAAGEWYSLQPDTVLVYTADDKAHLVSKASYGKRSSRLPLLSQCDDVVALEDAPRVKDRFIENLPELFIKAMQARSVDQDLPALNDLLDTFQDDLVCGLIREREYFGQGDISHRRTVQQAKMIMSQAIASKGWDRSDAGAMASLDTRNAALNYKTAELKAAKAIQESGAPSGP